MTRALTALQLTEAEAWLAIAERLDAMSGDDGFLCFEIDKLETLGVIADDVAGAMRARVKEQLPPSRISAYGGDTPYRRDEDRVGRLYAALLFAEMAGDAA